MNGKTYAAPTAELDVFDRVGGGDGFAAGFIYGLLSGESPETAIKLGWAHGALLTTFPGDTTMATLEQVRAFAEGGSARIQGDGGRSVAGMLTLTLRAAERDSREIYLIVTRCTVRKSEWRFRRWVDENQSNPERRRTQWNASFRSNTDHKGSPLTHEWKESRS